ncbi:MAG: hypothetical protein JWQ09_833 [Segetibacter sp.]|nr:hypothetical protein [Segetibacter sp.]
MDFNKIVMNEKRDFRSGYAYHAFKPLWEEKIL